MEPARRTVGKSDLHTGDGGFENNSVIDDTLNVSGILAASHGSKMAEQIQPLARHHKCAKLRRFYTRKADKALNFKNMPDEKAQKLSSRLNHNDTRHHRSSGYVAANPEFIFGDILVAQNQPFVFIEPEDAVKLLHLEILRIDLQNRLPVEDRPGFQIDL
jgi:hypothetical protein